MNRHSVFAGTLLATTLLLSFVISDTSRVAASTSSEDDNAVFAGNVPFGDAQVTPDGFAVRAFVPTGSLSQNCLATLSESNNAVPGITVFCGAREFQGQKGILFSAFFPQPIPSGLALSATIYQEHARGYGTPVFYPND